MGEVYLAEDLRLGRKVALKTLPADLARHSLFLERFRREARSAAALRHPNIVTIHSVEEAEDIPFLIMELIEGKTLAELIPPGGMELDRLLEIAIQVADALAAAHERSIVHRDIKPRNLMVDTDGRVKVLDFGIAKTLPSEDEPTWAPGAERDSLTREGQVVGTVSYMSPEQLQGLPLDPRSDLFSLGVVLYQMATGNLPFQGATPVDQMLAIAERQPPVPGVVRSGLPRRFDEIIARCLERDRGNRYQSARVLRGDLEALRREPVSSARPTFSISLPRVEQPVSGRATLVGAFLMVLFGAGFALVQPPVTGLVSDLWTGRKVASSPALAVLPLASLSGEREYFVDGMTDALIASLGNIGQVRVISRQSVMRYRGSEKALPEIARELGVDLVLTGSVMRSGAKVRITTELMQADPEEQLWAGTYKRGLQDVLALQDEVARDVAKQVRLELTDQEKSRLTDARPVDPAAYELYLQGRYHWDKRTADELRKAVEYFQKAIARDPAYASAYAGLADAYNLLGYFRFEPPDDAFAKARAAASRALALDPSLAEAHASLGYEKFFYAWNGSGAEKDFRRALDLNPSYASAHQWLSLYLASVGRLDEAVQHVRTARQLNPFSPTINTALAEYLFMQGNVEATVEQSRNAIDLEPRYYYSYMSLWMALHEQGKLDAAFQAFERALALQADPGTVEAARRIYRKSGYRAALAGTGAALATPSYRGEIWFLATTYLLAGQDGKALDWLERAVQKREPFLLWLRYYHEWKNLRGTPRFERILKQVERLRS